MLEETQCSGGQKEPLELEGAQKKTMAMEGGLNNKTSPWACRKLLLLMARADSRLLIPQPRTALSRIEKGFHKRGVK